MAVTREYFSGGANGAPIKIAATATPGTAIHTSHATAEDEIWLWASNSSGTAATLTIEFGGTTDPDNLVPKAMSIPANSPPICILQGQTLSNSKTIAAFSGTANVLIVTGYVNRIS